MISLLSACSLKNHGETSSVAVQIPSLADLKSAYQGKVVGLSSSSSSSITWDNACFMITVNGADIPPRTTGAGQIANGVFAGSVAPSSPGNSQALQLEVPKGNSRRFDVYAFFRQSSSDTCEVKDNINLFDRSRIGRLGGADNVSIQLDHEDVTIDISLPSQMYSGPDSLRGTSGSIAHQSTAANGYVVSSSVGFSEKRVSKTQNGYVVKRKRGLPQ